jgi:(2R)-3-sulfolactate dehydrogenase (NADP+)
MARLSVAEAGALATAYLVQAGAAPAVAGCVSSALVRADRDGQAGHGLSRLPSYAGQVRAGKIDGAATPTLAQTAAASLRVDAAHGFAYPALDLALPAVADLAGQTGTAAAALVRSHHIGQAGLWVETLAERGLVALVMSTTPAAMAFAGGKTPRLGTNPLAFAAPIAGRAPLVIDLALSQVARARIIAARAAGAPIPPDWANDADGNPTMDAAAAMDGTLNPIGGAKGAALALMVDVLCGALAGGQFGWEASSFLDPHGGPPSIGQMIVAFDTGAFGGADFAARMADLVATVAADGVRLPGDRRLAARARADQDGITIPDPLLQTLTLAKDSAA